MSAHDPFFQLYSDLPREAPGDRENLDWALAQIELPADGVICDAGCGTGADLAALLEHVPQGRVVGIDAHPGHVETARKRFAGEPRISIEQGNFATLPGSYDLIWSAGAIYFIGITVALMQWKGALKPGGAVAFSQVFWKTDKPSAASKDLWADYGHMPFEAEVYDQVKQAGYAVIAGRELPAAAWEAYYQPLEARIAALRAGAGPELAQVLDGAELEIRTWRAHPEDFGYLQVVARPA